MGAGEGRGLCAQSLVPYLSEISCFLIQYLLVTTERIFVNSENLEAAALGASPVLQLTVQGVLGNVILFTTRFSTSVQMDCSFK